MPAFAGGNNVLSIICASAFLWAIHFLVLRGVYGTLNSLGNTGFGVDLTRGEDVSAPGDTGYSVGGAMVQTIEGYDTELYG